MIVDLDDTLAEAGQAILQYVNSRLPVPVAWRDLTREHREENEGPYYAMVQEFLSDPELVLQYEPSADARPALARLVEASYELHLVSARKEPLHAVTSEWLERNDLAQYFWAVHGRPAAERGSKFKLRIAREVCPVAAFDDTLDVAEALSSAGIHVYLIDKPWNRTSSLPVGVERARSFRGAVDALIGRA